MKEQTKMNYLTRQERLLDILMLEQILMTLLVILHMLTLVYLILSCHIIPNKQLAFDKQN